MLRNAHLKGRMWVRSRVLKLRSNARDYPKKASQASGIRHKGTLNLQHTALMTQSTLHYYTTRSLHPLNSVLSGAIDIDQGRATYVKHGNLEDIYITLILPPLRHIGHIPFSRESFA